MEDKSVRTYQLSKEGKKELEDRLAYLNDVERPKTVERLAAARELGDLSENAEYKFSKDALARISSEILEIEDKLKHAVIYDDDANKDGKNKGVISLGSKIQVMNKALGKVFEYTIVGTVEADIMKGRISNESPVGKALIGKKKGDVVRIELAQGGYDIEVLDVIK